MVPNIYGLKILYEYPIINFIIIFFFGARYILVNININTCNNDLYFSLQNGVHIFNVIPCDVCSARAPGKL